VYYGLKNDGAQAIATRLSGKPMAFPVGISIAKTNCPATVDTAAGIADYIQAAEYMKDIGDYVTLNISCPNAYGGEPFTDPKKLDQLLHAYRALKIHKPVFLKLAAELSQEALDAIIDVGEAYDIDGYICTNLKKQEGVQGGMSGKLVQEESDDMVSYVYKKVQGKRIVIGCGGIFSAEDAYRKIKLGASLVQLITGMIFEGPQVVGEINAGLTKLLKADGYTHISEAIGIDNT